MFCSDEYSLTIYETTQLGLFSPEVPSLVYYSHVTAVVVALLVSLFVIYKSKTVAAKVLVSISLAFAALSTLDILLWTQIDVGIVMLLWSTWLTFFTLIFGLSFYFLYAFIRKQDITFGQKGFFAAILILVELFSITALNLEYFDLAYCEAGEGVMMLNAIFGLSFIVFISAMIFGIRETRKLKEKDTRKSAALATIGIGAFLLLFSFATYLASIFNSISPNGSFEFLVEQYGYFGMTIFIGFLSYIIVQYNAFRIKMVAATALVFGLTSLIAAQFLFVRTPGSVALTAVTLFIAICFGVLLIRSVRQEVKQREELEQVTHALEKANTRLKELDKAKSEFVSIASHQLRSPLTSIRGYVSMLLENSFGNIPEKAKVPLERINTSAKHMALAVEDYLSISRIESGNMTYEKSDFNLRDEVERIVDDMRPTALKQGLILLFRSDLKSKTIVNTDVGKTTQIAHNLINNSLKYTQKGSVTVFMHDDIKARKIFVDVSDTGLGMSQETISRLFQKFSRADNANEVNSVGTGLGLFIASKMAEDMGGSITAFSEGEGEGSRFTLTLPLKM
jgi:signal transduction histidine kinase